MEPVFQSGETLATCVRGTVVSVGISPLTRISLNSSTVCLPSSASRSTMGTSVEPSQMLAAGMPPAYLSARFSARSDLLMPMRLASSGCRAMLRRLCVVPQLLFTVTSCGLWRRRVITLSAATRMESRLSPFRRTMMG